MKLVRARDLKQMPWKNGGGVTTEIAIEPVGASLAQMNFKWRLSRAEIRSQGPFSKFPGYDRVLMVLGPDSLVLNGVLRSPLNPFSFSGDDAIEARLSGKDGVTSDLGVIMRRGFECVMQVFTLPAEGHQSLLVGERFTDICLYLVSGAEISVGISGVKHHLSLGDTFIASVDELQANRFELASLAPGSSTVAVIFLGSTSTSSQR